MNYHQFLEIESEKKQEQMLLQQREQRKSMANNPSSPFNIKDLLTTNDNFNKKQSTDINQNLMTKYGQFRYTQIGDRERVASIGTQVAIRHQTEQKQDRVQSIAAQSSIKFQMDKKTQNFKIKSKKQNQDIQQFQQFYNLQKNIVQLQLTKNQFYNTNSQQKILNLKTQNQINQQNNQQLKTNGTAFGALGKEKIRVKNLPGSISLKNNVKMSKNVTASTANTQKQSSGNLHNSNTNQIDLSISLNGSQLENQFKQMEIRYSSTCAYIDHDANTSRHNIQQSLNDGSYHKKTLQGVSKQQMYSNLDLDEENNFSQLFQVLNQLK